MNHISRPRKQWRGIKSLLRLVRRSPAECFWFVKSWRDYQTLACEGWRSPLNAIYPIVQDRNDTSGTGARGHYFLQDLWAAQNVATQKPRRHVDVGSSVVGFVSHVASFCPLEFVDIRPLPCKVPNLVWLEGSINRLPHKDGSVESLSCLHVIEHIGLGRYGDPIDPDAWIGGLRELGRILAVGGQLLIGTPVGKRLVRFNAHRIFDPEDIPRALANLKLEEFSLVENDDSLAWTPDASFEDARKCDYGCGLYRFSKQ